MPFRKQIPQFASPYTRIIIILPLLHKGESMSLCMNPLNKFMQIDYLLILGFFTKVPVMP